MVIVILFVFAQGMWLETTQEDFADGVYEKNIYASHRGDGTMEFAPRFDLNNDGCIDLFTADGGATYVRIYWGNPSGYLANDTTLFPTTSAANCDAADLDCDGYADFLVVHQSDPKISIYWGTPTGPHPSFYLDIPTIQTVRQAIFVADFNKDGYLDIATTQQIIPDNGAIFWGSDSGYYVSNRTDLPVIFGVHNIEVGDFNWDTWLDILFIEYQNANNKIYWGSSSGYSPSNCTLLPGPGSFGASVADLNRDRSLDLIFTAWYNSESYIYWGNPSGYSPANMQVLNPGNSYGGSTVADINEDGYLDIVYHHGGYSSSGHTIYWGRTTGYADGDTSLIGLPVTTTGGFVADLNYDGSLDVFCNVNGSASNVFWGPDFYTSTALPVNNDHEGMFREIGSVYDRRYREHYISSVFNAADTVDWGTVEWDDSLPTGTTIDFRVKTGNTPMHDTTWSAWFLVSSGESIPDSLNSQYIQYMAHLKYTNPAYLPCLYEVRISYDTLTGIYTYDEPCFQIPVRISPNPFVTNTKISYIVSEPKSAVTIRIYDVAGRIIKTLIDQKHGSGSYDIMWSGDDDENRQVPEGIYYLTFESDNKTDNITSFKIIHIKE